MPRRSSPQPPPTPLAVASPFDYDDEDLDLEDQQAAEKIGDLADLDDPQFSEWEWTIYRLRTSDDMQRAGTRNPRVWIARKMGPISLSDIQTEHGGGWFEFWGKLNGRLLKRYRREIEGEPRRAGSAPVASTASPATSNGTEPRRRGSATRRLLAAVLEAQRKSDERYIALLSTLATQRHDPPALPPAPGIGEIVGAVKGIHEMSVPRTPRETNNIDPLAFAEAMLNNFRQGYTMGQTADPAAEPSARGVDWGPIIDKGLNVFGQMIQDARVRRAAAANAPPPRQPSSAAVVDDSRAAAHPATPQPPPAPPAADERTAAASPSEHRWATAVEVVYRGMLNGRDPGDIAASLEDILNETEQASLRGAPGAEPTADQVLGYLAPLLEQFPQLATEQGRVYLTAVLTALREVEPAEAEG